MQQVQENQKTITDAFQNTVDNLDAPMSRLTIGEKRDWFMVGQEMYLLDFTDIQDQIKLMRDVLAAIIWIEFFMFLLFYLSPKLNL